LEDANASVTVPEAVNAGRLPPVLWGARVRAQITVVCVSQSENTDASFFAHIRQFAPCVMVTRAR